MRALAHRPTTLERWPKGVHPGIVALDPRAARRRRVLPEARPEGRARLRRDRADRVPLRPPRRRGLPDRGRGRRLGGADGHDHVPPVAGARRRRRPSRRAAHRPRPAAGHRLRRRRARRRRGARRCSASSATPASRRPRAAAACTSTCGSSRAGRSPTCATRRSRSGASSSGGCPGEVTTKWWKEERGERIFVDYNQNARDRTIASAYSDPAEAGRAGLGAADVGRAARRRARGLHGRDDAGALRRGRRPPRGDRRRRPLAAAAARHVRARRGGRHALSARLPEDAGRAEARAAVARPRPARAD